MGEIKICPKIYLYNSDKLGAEVCWQISNVSCMGKTLCEVSEKSSNLSISARGMSTLQGAVKRIPVRACRSSGRNAAVMPDTATKYSDS